MGFGYIILLLWFSPVCMEFGSVQSSWNPFANAVALRAGILPF